MLILKLGWKNIWRNPIRSAVVIGAVLVGTWAGIFIMAFSTGMTKQYIKNQLDTYVGHIQIHNPRYLQENLPQYDISQPDSLILQLKKNAFVTKIAAHSKVQGLAMSSANTFGVSITGIDTTEEKKISTIYQDINEGDYLTSDVRNPVIIGQELADKLDLRLHSKLVLNFQDIHNDISAGAFRVVGIFSTNNSSFDEKNVFVQKKDLDRLLDRQGLVDELVLRVDNIKQAPAYAKELQKEYPNLKIQSWGDIAPELRYADISMDYTMYIFMGVLILALTLGIINTMLMAVMERTKELGMLMAVGMNRLRVFSMILVETFYLIFVAVPIGLLLAWGTVAITAHTGIDLSAFAKGLAAYGLSTVIHPELGTIYYLNISIMMGIAAILAAIYPAWKALNLKPVEAIRKL
ncbi:MAG TPA: FtsX-like permease family protein [Balneolaceae bacterium]|nr:FtsX-like permease family protein [Balneolaceae bacterium]